MTTMLGRNFCFLIILVNRATSLWSDGSTFLWSGEGGMPVASGHPANGVGRVDLRRHVNVEDAAGR